MSADYMQNALLAMMVESEQRMDCDASSIDDLVAYQQLIESLKMEKEKKAELQKVKTLLAKFEKMTKKQLEEQQKKSDEFSSDLMALDADDQLSDEDRTEEEAEED